MRYHVTYARILGERLKVQGEKHLGTLRILV
jgi:hypothetical protein